MVHACGQDTHTHTPSHTKVHFLHPPPTFSFTSHLFSAGRPFSLSRHSHHPSPTSSHHTLPPLSFCFLSLPCRHSAERGHGCQPARRTHSRWRFGEVIYHTHDTHIHT